VPDLQAAIEFSVRAHAGQRRKDGRSPYVVHPIGVLRHLTADLGVTEPELGCAAVLHDVVEDTGTPLEVLRERFGPRVARLVEELTIPAELHGPGVPEARKIDRILADLGRIGWDSILVKLCDRLDNLRDLENTAWEPARRDRYAAQSERIEATLRTRWAEEPPPEPLRPPLEAGLRRLSTATADWQARRPPSKRSAGRAP
jgi:(p)ppGpp synthase/HD superfamily hydrolase